MKIKTTVLMFMAAFFLFGSNMVNGQTEVWNKVHPWNTDRFYRGVDYNPFNNHLYVAGTEGSYVGDAAGTTPEDAKIIIFDATTGDSLNFLSPATAFGGDWGYGIRDVEVDDGGAIFATTGTSNQFNPVQLYYWENEDAEPVLLWKDASGTADDFGGSFSVYGDFNTEALIIIPFVNVAKVYYFEVVAGVLGDVNTLDLAGLTTVKTPHVQALGTKISDGFWYNNVVLEGPVKFNGSGAIVAQIPSGVITGGNLDTKYFTAGLNEYLVVSNTGSFQLINITGKAADLSDVTAMDMTEVAGTVPTLESVWPHVYGSGQEQAVLGNPDGSYAIWSLSGGNYIKMLSTDGAPIATDAKLTGSPLVGEVKTVEYTYIDVNGDAEATSEIKWYIADDAMGTNIAEITANAGQTTYTLDAADAGKYITFTVLPIAATGTVSDLTHLVSSAVFGPVLSAMDPPVATEAALTGVAKVGEALTATYTYSDPNGDLEGMSIFEWFRADDMDGTAWTKVFEGSLSYTAVGDDAGKYIAFVVTPVAETGFLLEGEADTVYTDATVLFPPLPPTASNLMLSGREQVGGTLTGSYTYEDLNGDLEGASTIKWYRDPDSTGTSLTEIASDVLTYELVEADLDNYIMLNIIPVTEDGDKGDSIVVYSNEIEARPTPVPPVASDVVLTGIPEVGIILSATYTYTDDIDDPEGVSVYKWYIADDAAGTNAAEIAGAGSQTYLVQESEIGKFFAFEVTPVALTGGDLTGAPVMSAYTATGAIASTNTIGLERLWLGSAMKGTALHYLNGAATTERGIAVGEDHIYVASRKSGTQILILDKADGSYIGELDTEGISGGIYTINDVEVSDDGQILAAPLAGDGNFWVYKWSDENAKPEKWLEASGLDTEGASWRLGDKFSVTGDLTDDAIIMAAQSGGNNIVRWVVTDGVVGAHEIITLNGLGSMETSPAVVPFSASTDANLLIDGKGLAPRIFDNNMDEVGSIAKIDDYSNYKIQSNSPNVFEYKGRTMAAFFQAMRQEPLGARIIIADITAQPYRIVDSTEYISDLMAWDGYLGEVDATTDGEYYYAYLLQAKYALGAYRGKLELPEFASGITTHGGDTVTATFDMEMEAITKTDAENWTLTANSTALVVDSIYTEGTNVVFVLNAAVEEGDLVEVSYNGMGTYASFNGMPLSAFGPEVIENITGAEAPVASDVAIAGTERVGETFTGSYTYTDAEGDTEGVSKYQWYYATDASGSDQLKIIGETNIDYVVGADISGKYIAFEVTPVAETGGMAYLTGEAVMSEWVRIIPTGIETGKLESIVAYPNPVDDMLSLSNADAVKSIQLIDVTGKLVQNIETSMESTVSIDMSSFNSGIYYLKLYDEAGATSILKIVKVQ